MQEFCHIVPKQHYANEAARPLQVLQDILLFYFGANWQNSCARVLLYFILFCGKWSNCLMLYEAQCLTFICTTGRPCSSARAAQLASPYVSRCFAISETTVWGMSPKVTMLPWFFCSPPSISSSLGQFIYSSHIQRRSETDKNATHT